MKMRELSIAAVLVGSSWPAWAKEGQPGVEPLFLIAGGAGAFAAGVLFGIWICKKFLCGRDNQR
jgi:hypothetical protein